MRPSAEERANEFVRLYWGGFAGPSDAARKALRFAEDCRSDGAAAERASILALAHKLVAELDTVMDAASDRGDDRKAQTISDWADAIRHFADEIENLS